MRTRMKEVLRFVPGLQDGVRHLRKRLHQAMRQRIEAQVSATKGYEILVVFGMRRSGNHVAINWILEQVNGPAVFYNNINPDKPPFAASRTEYRRRSGPSPRIVLSYEDVDPDRLLSPPLLSFLEERIMRHGARVRFALIHRDPYNLFASRLRKWPEHFANPEAIAAQNSLYQRLSALAVSPKPLWRDTPLIPILYNDLVSDAATRVSLAQALGINTGDRGLDEVPIYGHGSSFDGTTLSGENIRGNVFERWRALEADPTFQMIIKDPDLQEIGQRLFEIAPPVLPLCDAP